MITSSSQLAEVPYQSSVVSSAYFTSRERFAVVLDVSHK